MRLTLLYSGLFLLLGTTVIVVIVVLTGQSPIIAHVSVGPTSASAHPIARVPQPFRTTELVNGLAAQRSSDVARVFTVNIRKSATISALRWRSKSKSAYTESRAAAWSSRSRSHVSVR